MLFVLINYVITNIALEIGLENDLFQLSTTHLIITVHNFTH